MQGLVSNGQSADELLAELMNKDTELFRLDVDVDDAVPRSLTPAHSVDNALETAISLRPLNLPTVKVAGYSLPTKLLSTDVWSSKMIMTSTTLRNVQRLAQAVALDVPVIVQGEVGCGKSFLVKELAAVMGQESTLVDLHLDDQTDSKTLIGAYVCSDVPGEFLWQPGVVTQAAMKGRWLVIEDIDRVPLEVAASLSALLERKRLYLPDRGREVPVHPSFRIFGTRSVTHSDAASTSSHTLHSMLTVPSLRHFSYLWHFVSIEVPTTEEIELIITTRFPSLLPVVVNKLIETYMLFGGRSMHVDAHAHDVAIELDPVHSDSALPGQLNAIAKRFSRQFTLRDLMKAARRCERYRGSFNVVSGLLTDELRRNLLCEIVDVFAAAMRDSNAFVEVVRALGRCWGVADCDIEGAVFMAQPQLHHNATSDQASDKVSAAGTMTIGRVVIPIASTDAEKLPIQQFAFTKYSLRMLERVAACVSMGESVLLVGETGAGKTTSVQELANLTHRKLIVQNLSLSTDASDLLGGYRPVTLRQLFLPSYERFLDLFADTFSSSQNSEFVTIVAQTFRKQQWKKLLKAFQKASDNAMKKIQQQAISDSSDSSKGKFVKLQQDWKEFSERSARFEANLPRIEVGFAFAFVDGLLVDAMRRGHWVLLDEINLAAPETLQALVGVLDGQSLCMTERGDTEPVPRHPDFRLFAAMNPPTDVGKRELPIALRSRFTELYCEELTDPQDLRQVVERVLSDDGSVGGTMTEHVDDIVSVYLGCRASADVNLVDGSGQRPRFSLRSLTRSLRASKAFMDIGLRPFNRTLFEGFLLNFQTLLDGNSRNFMWTFLRNSLNVTGNTKELAQPPQRPGGKKLTADDWVLVKPFWLRTGKLTPVDWAAKDSRGITKFVLTATVDAAVRNLAAAIAAGVAPVLLQGPTSVGKTSMIEYLAARTGHKCVRINNHEHTDVQEYVGGYVTNQQGHLEFRDGLLVDALRNGHWIILDGKFRVDCILTTSKAQLTLLFYDCRGHNWLRYVKF
jgi:midasin (ATPase involved in ribosome maturation)